MLSLLSSYRDLVTSPEHRRVIIALTATYMLVQVASFPVALSMPSIADHFDTSIASASWIIVAELLALGSTVFLAARLGEKYGHNRIFFLGVLITTLGAGMAGFSQTLIQLVIFRAIQGVGAAMITGNANAILAGHFAPEQRAMAYALPITGARIGTFLGLIVFAIFLQFVSWRLIFYTFIPLGAIALWATIPMLKQGIQDRPKIKVPLDMVGAVIFVGTIATLIASGMHLHEGEESFTSSDALGYHVPMHLLFLALLGLFIVLQTRARNPFMDFQLFKYKHFSLAIFSNITFHFSMLAITTLVPVLVERGFGLGPLFVLYVLLPHQSIGLIVPVIAGWYYDKYQPRLLRPISMALIALGIFFMGILSSSVPFWFIPLLLAPTSVGSSIFNTVNNALIMNSLPQEHKGFASGMIETTRQVGHTMGATVAASALGLALPATIALLSPTESQEFYVKGLQISALAVVSFILVGAFVSFYHKPVTYPQPNQQASAADGD